MSLEVVAYRACAYERPLWALPNRAPGRWNDAGDPPTQYLALHPMGPWAELLRQLALRTAPEARAARAPTWALRVVLAQEPLRIGFAEAAAAGLGPEELVADDQGPCRAAARRLRAEGVRALVVPSAALPGTENLVLLEPRVVVDYHREPLADELDTPAALLQQEGRCPEGLWDAVHHRGSRRPHAALRAFGERRPFAFHQPPVTAESLAA